MKSYKEIELECEFRFGLNAQYWHLFTNGKTVDTVFDNREEFIVGMNLLAISKCHIPNVKIFTFNLMNNHLHIILAGHKDDCIRLFEDYKTRLKRYFSRKGQPRKLDGFNCSLINIDNLNSLRIEIAYVNRNGFLARKDCTPFSYPWGANAFFFNEFHSLLNSIHYDTLSFRDKRLICRSNSIDIPANNLLVHDGLILPSSFCNIKEAESFYRDAHHYFNIISKNYEAYSAIAKNLSERTFLTDEDMISAASSLCFKEYGEKRPVLLQPQQKLDLARRLHQDYNASNRQICSILKIEKDIIETLFPKA